MFILVEEWGLCHVCWFINCQDYKKYIRKFIDENFKPDLILISAYAFDVPGRGFLKESIFDVVDELNWDKNDFHDKVLRLLSKAHACTVLP